MQLTDGERAMLDGAEGEVVAEALDYLKQFGEAFAGNGSFRFNRFRSHGVLRKSAVRELKSRG